MGVVWQGENGVTEPAQSASATDTVGEGGRLVAPASGDVSADSHAISYLAASDSGGHILLPGDGFVFSADFGRDGSDLTLTGADGHQVVVVDYFASETPPDVFTPDGFRLSGHTVESLAGPVAPAQYAQAGTEGMATEIGQVDSLTGTVKATGADGTTVDLGVGSSVFQGDTLETSPDGSINIVFLDGTTFSLGSDTTMVLDELIYDPAQNEGSLVTSVVTGTFVFITGEIAGMGDDAMQVETPSGTIGIRGTKVACNLGVGNGQAVCMLLPHEDGTVGKIVFSNGAGSVTVSQAYEAILASGFSVAVQTVQGLEDQLQTLFPNLDLGVGPVTESGPGPLSSGGTFFDFFSEALQLLNASLTPEGVLAGTTLNENFLGLDFSVNPGGIAVAASLRVAEVTAGGPGTASAGNLDLGAGAIPTDVTLFGFAITSNGSPLSLTSGGVPVILTQDGNTVDGTTTEGDPVFRFVLNDDGTFTFFMFGALDHPLANQTGSDDVIQVSFGIEVDFITGETLQTVVQANILDAGPSASIQTDTVDEASSLGTPVDGVVPIVAGADGLQSVELTGFSTKANGSPISLTSGGDPVSLVQTGANTYEGRAGGETVFTLTFNAATGAYTFTLLEAVDQAPGGGTTPLFITFNVAVTDGDNDTAVSNIVIRVNDDVPHAVADANALLEGQQVEGNVVTGDGQAGGADDPGADGATVVAVNGGPVAAEGETAIAGTYGTLYIQADGSYRYVANESVPNVGGPVNDVFAYVLRDGDGDSSTVNLTIAVGDANVPTAESDSLTFSEALGDTDPSDPLNGFTAIVNTGNLTGNDDFGGDGAGATQVADANYSGGLGGLTSKTVTAASVTLVGDGWTLVIDRATGDYTFTQTAALDHDAVSGDGTFTYTIRDADGSLSGPADFTVTITDDSPLAVDDSNATAEGQEVQGNVITGAGQVDGTDDPGVDGGNVASVEGNAVAAAGETEIAGTFGTLYMQADGSYRYVANASVPNEDGAVSDSFDYVLRDGDGNESVATLTVAISDANTPTAFADSLTFSEAEGDTLPGDPLNAFAAIEKTGNLTGNDDFGGDGSGAIQIADADYTGGLGDLTSKDVTAATITLAGAGWTLVIDRATGDYTFTQTAPLDHSTLSGIGAFTYTIQDSDNDVSPPAAFTVTIQDDDPLAVADTNAVDEGQAVNGNVITGAGQAGGVDDPGADGSGGILSLQHAGDSYDRDSAVGGNVLSNDGTTIVIATALGGSLSFNFDTGAYGYTAPALDGIDADAQETFTYVLLDGDGGQSSATLTIDVDDVPQAVDDVAAATEDGPEIFGELILGSDILGDGPGRVTQISFNTIDATLAAAYAGMGFDVVEEGDSYSVTVAVPDGDSVTFTTVLGGTLTLSSDGSYDYVPPALGDIRADGVESFTYTLADSGGDTDTAAFSINVENVPEPVHAALLSNTNITNQVVRIIISDDQSVLTNTQVDRPGTGQEDELQAILLGDDGQGVLLDDSASYVVAIKFVSGGGTVNITDFQLITDPNAPNLMDPDNIFLNLSDGEGTIQLGQQGNGVDGIIWQVDGDGSGFTYSDAILYDVSSVSSGGNTYDFVTLDTNLSHSSFSLDLGLVPLDDGTTPVGDLPADTSILFDDIEVVDISGSQGDEANTLTLSAHDIFDVTDNGNTLIVQGNGNDTLTIADTQNWHDGDPSTPGTIDPSGTVTNDLGTFDVYVADFGDTTVNLLVDPSQVTVQFESAMA